jgi:hypothetical protein
MSPKKLAAFRLDEQTIEALAAIKERVGIPVAEQVRRALELWISKHGDKADRKRAATRKRP